MTKIEKKIHRIQKKVAKIDITLINDKIINKMASRIQIGNMINNLQQKLQKKPQKTVSNKIAEKQNLRSTLQQSEVYLSLLLCCYVLDLKDWGRNRHGLNKVCFLLRK